MFNTHFVRSRRIVLRNALRCSDAEVRAAFGEAADVVAHRLERHVRRAQGRLPLDWTRDIERIVECRTDHGTATIRYRYLGKDGILVRSMFFADELRITISRPARSSVRSQPRSR